MPSSSEQPLWALGLSRSRTTLELTSRVAPPDHLYASKSSALAAQLLRYSCCPRLSSESKHQAPSQAASLTHRSASCPRQAGHNVPDPAEHSEASEGQHLESASTAQYEPPIHSWGVSPRPQIADDSHRLPAILVRVSKALPQGAGKYAAETPSKRSLGHSCCDRKRNVMCPSDVPGYFFDELDHSPHNTPIGRSPPCSSACFAHSLGAQPIISLKT